MDSTLYKSHKKNGKHVKRSSTSASGVPKEKCTDDPTTTPVPTLPKHVETEFTPTTVAQWPTSLWEELDSLLEAFRAKMETQTGSKIKILKSGNATEYVSATQSNRLTELGIIHEKSAPYTPQQNGVAERENRTLVEMARSMLYASKSKLPPSLWAETVAYSTYILKIIPSNKSTSSPFEKWNGQKPNLSHLRIFGSRAFIHVPYVRRTKLQPKFVEEVMVGFCESSKAYRIYICKGQHISRSLSSSAPRTLLTTSTRIEPQH